MEISIAASIMEPVASAVTRVEASAVVLCWALRDVPCRDVAFAASAVNRRHYTVTQAVKADKCTAVKCTIVPVQRNNV